jgi:hypothetical protein
MNNQKAVTNHQKLETLQPFCLDLRLSGKGPAGSLSSRFPPNGWLVGTLISLMDIILRDPLLKVTRVAPVSSRLSSGSSRSTVRPSHKGKSRRPKSSARAKKEERCRQETSVDEEHDPCSLLNGSSSFFGLRISAFFRPFGFPARRFACDWRCA